LSTWIGISVSYMISVPLKNLISSYSSDFILEEMASCSSSGLYWSVVMIWRFLLIPLAHQLLLCFPRMNLSVVDLRLRKILPHFHSHYSPFPLLLLLHQQLQNYHLNCH
ncbi:hypothetical protein L9F63_016432, partial [Diploptera punctata]